MGGAMNGRVFKVGTFAKPNGQPFPAIVLDDSAIDLAQAHEAYRASGRPALSSTSESQSERYLRGLCCRPAREGGRSDHQTEDATCGV
jgi:hypothetical protein